ncbi:hypothetical protein ABT369_37795 [Dactylosporangium sp. NPDC000244]|uniref:hypothetical protein n=1 Tax=Dactylosporangium sp. NPDC000244 TaxID=3154365 RepID=UPI00331936D0
MARYSTLLLALLIASPALYAGFVTHQLDMKTALLRLLIAVPVAAIMLAVFRMITRGYGQEPEPPTRPDATTGEATAPGTGEPLRAEAVAGEPFPQRRSEDNT